MNEEKDMQNEQRHAVMDCFDKPLRLLLQMDNWVDVHPDSVMHPDDDGDATMAGWQYDLRRCDIPVRVQILHGTPHETAVRLLRKTLAWLERDPQLIAEGDDVLAAKGAYRQKQCAGCAGGWDCPF